MITNPSTGKPPRLAHDVLFLDDDFEEQQGTILQQNGNLTLVRDSDGNEVWRAPFEVRS